ncbi:hypothetical protein FOZ62_020345, partial [Perkinsus olseni]
FVPLYVWPSGLPRNATKLMNDSISLQIVLLSSRPSTVGSLTSWQLEPRRRPTLQRFWRARRAKRLLRIVDLWSRLTHQAVVSTRRREALLVLRRPEEQGSLHRDCSEASTVHAKMFTPVELPVVQGCRPSEEAQRPFR